MKSKKPLLLSALAAVACAACAAGQKAPLNVNEPDRQRATAPGLNEPDRVIRRDDMVRITLRRHGSTLGSLEGVRKNGEVATPDGSSVKADGLTLAEFLKGLRDMYRRVPGNEDLKVEAFIWSSPYRVVRYNPDATPPAATGTNRPPATVYPRIFRAPLTVWEAIQLDGGIPRGVDPSRVRVLKRDLARKTLDCSGAEGRPDGCTPLESGDYLFLVPEGTPLSTIFD